MTSFSQQTHTYPWGSLDWELRTVNHRYLDISVRFPDMLRSQEMQIREKIKKHLLRGKVYASLRFHAHKASVDLLLNTDFLKKLSKIEKKVRLYFPNLTFSFTDILALDPVLETAELNDTILHKCALDLLDQALVDIVTMRQREGAGISAFIDMNSKKIMFELKKIKQYLPDILKDRVHRMRERLAHCQDDLNNQRLEQEIVMLAQRLDVAEELQRLDAHLIEVASVVKTGGLVGRRLDFLMQELNREINTLSSKSINIDMTQCSIEIKVLIEEIREQVQNVE